LLRLECTGWRDLSWPASFPLSAILKASIRVGDSAGAGTQRLDRAES
jgi:hypothetical protein